MASGYNIGPKISIEGEAEFKRSIGQINTNIRTLNTEMQSVASQFEKTDRSEKALTAQNEVLNKQLSAQKERLELLSSHLEKVTAAYGADSKEAQKLTQDVNKTRAAVNELSRELEHNTNELKAQADAVTNALTGETAFRTSISKTESTIKTLKTELKAVESAYGSNDKSVSALSARQEVLAQLHEEQKSKLSQLKTMLAEASAKYGEADERTQGWARQVNEAQTEVNQLGRALDENKQDMQDVQRGYNDAGQTLDKFGRVVKQTGIELSKAQQDLVRLRETAGMVGSNLDSMGNTLTMGLTAPLVAAGTASIHFASDTAESLNKVEVAFGAASDGIKTFSDSTLTTYGLAKGTALDMAALYGDMATSMGFSQSAAADMSKTLVGLAGDLASFKNISVDEANTALKSIFTGETESLKNLGVVITQTNLDAYAMSQGFRTAFKDMDQTQQVAVRLQYVLENTKNAQGDFARTSDGAANQMRIFQESLKEAAATAGNDLLPIITPIITNLSAMAQSFGALDDGTRKAIVQTGLFLAALGPMLKLTGGLAKAVQAGAAAYYLLTAAKSADTAVTATATTAQAGLNAVMAANPIGIVATAIGMLVAGLAAFGVSAALAGDKQEDFNSKLRGTIETSEKAADSIREDAAAKQANLETVRDLIPKIEELNSKTDRTSEEQYRLNGLVETANSLYPGLIGQVDALTGSYDINRQSIENTIEAMKRQYELEANQEIIQEKYQAIAKLKQQLSGKEQEYAQAVERTKASQQALHEENLKLIPDYATLNELYDQRDYDVSVEEEAKLAVDDLTAAIDSLTAEAEGLIDTNVNLAVSTQTVGEAADTTTDSYDSFSAGLTAFTSVLEKVRGGCELLSKAQKETEETGYLNSATVATLLEQYPELAAYLEETTDGYRLTDGALQNYIASQEQEADLALGNAQAAAQAVIDAEIKKRGVIIDTTLSIENQLQALATMYGTVAKTMGAAVGTVGKLATSMAGMPGVAGDVIGKAMDTSVQTAMQQQANDVQMALDTYRKAVDEKKSLDRAFASIAREQTTGSGKGGSKSSGSGSSKKEKTQADIELEAYKQARKELDHQRATGLISDEKYYEDGTALASKYLKDQSDERRKWDEDIYKYQQGAYGRDLDELDRQLEAQEITRDEYQDRSLELQKKYLTEGSAEWLKAEEKNQAFREESYKKEREELNFRHEMGLISERDYCVAIERLRDQHLTRNSEAWRAATLEVQQINQKMLEEQQKAIEEFQKSLEVRTDALKNFAGLFDEISGDSEVTGRKLLSNLRGQVSTMENWQADMEDLMSRGVTGPLLEELQEMGPKAAQEIRALTELTDNELEQYRKLFAEKSQLAAEQAEKELTPITVPLIPGELDLSGLQAEVDASGVSIGGGEALSEAIKPTTEGIGTVNQQLATLREFTAGIELQGKSDAVAAQEHFSQMLDQFDKWFLAERQSAAQQLQTMREQAQKLDATMRANAANMADRINVAAAQIVAAVSQIEVNIINNHYSEGGSDSSLNGGAWESVNFDYTHTKYDARAAVQPGASARSSVGESLSQVGEAIVNGLASILPGNAGSRRVEIPLTINNREFARAIYDDLEDEGKRRGK